MADLHDLGLLAVRVCLSAVYLFSGIDKLMHRADAIAELEALKLPQPALLRPLVIAVQLVGGAMVLLGVEARFGALMLLGFTALATLIAHRPFDHEGPARRLDKMFALAARFARQRERGEGGEAQSAEPGEGDFR